MRRAIQSFRNPRLFRGVLAGVAVAALAVFLPGVASRADETQKPTEEKPAAKAATAADQKPAAKSATPAADPDPDKKTDVSAAEQLEFQQAKVSAEMTELEERMFRLSESLKAFEPENSSRLMIGLKYAREEQIVHQMKEIQDELRKASLAESVIEQKQLLAKLERLEQLLLSADLDFQMRMERLRQIREALRKLDTAIREEDREKKLSQETARQEERLKLLEKRLSSLQELIQRQTAHVERDTQLAKAAIEKPEGTESKAAPEPTPDKPTPDKPTPDKGAADKGAADKPAADKGTTSKDALQELTDEQETTRTKTADLAAAAKDEKAPQAKEDPLADAGKQMAAAVDQLKLKKPSAAQPPMLESLDALKKALAAGRKEQEQLKKDLDAQKFAAMAKDQAGNRQLNDNITEMVRGAGDNGKSALSDLSKAGGSMTNAERQLGGRQAGSADMEQGSALASLKAAREKLAEEAEKLQEQLRAEVKKRLLEGLAVILEQQVMVRESTAGLAPRVAKGSRQAQGSVVGLSKSEGKIIVLNDELINMVEETEFGIALPAAMRMVREEMAGVQAYLANGDASEPVVAAEKQVEEDIKLLFAAVKQMPSGVPPKDGKGGKGGRGEQERELNRIVAELKLIRLLQLRVNKDTLDTDAQQQKVSGISPAVRRHIEDLSGRQEDVRDVTEKLATERGDEVRQN